MSTLSGIHLSCGITSGKKVLICIIAIPHVIINKNNEEVYLGKNFTLLVTKLSNSNTPIEIIKDMGA
jgi:hypothetical protein